jgi:hypothetical protein
MHIRCPGTFKHYQDQFTREDQQCVLVFISMSNYFFGKKESSSTVVLRTVRSRGTARCRYVPEAGFGDSEAGGPRFAARPASQSRHPRAGLDGSTNLLRHRRLCTDSPSRVASYTRTAGPWDNSCPQPVSGAVSPSRSDILERACADVDVTSGICTRAQVTIVPL